MFSMENEIGYESCSDGQTCPVSVEIWNCGLEGNSQIEKDPSPALRGYGSDNWRNDRSFFPNDQE